MTDEELGELIGGIRIGEDHAAAIRRYVRETQDHYGSVVSRAEVAEQELKRVRKLLKKALGGKR